MSVSTIYILYNAQASFLGKFNYVCRKISAPADSSPCYACDLTHGGLRLNETAEWTETKRRVHANVEQLHKDELNTDLKDYVKANNVGFPAVLGKASGGHLKLLMDADALKSASKDHEAFLLLLATSAKREEVPLSVEEKATLSMTG